MTTILLREVFDDDGRSAFGEWLDKLDVVPGAKVRVALARMSQGNLSAVKWFRGIGEYKIDFGPGYRIYFSQEGKTILLLLAGGTKKQQQRDIEAAILRLAIYKARSK
jgi:putative addiction module killer protein